jgi:subtilase family serine protease
MVHAHVRRFAPAWVGVAAMIANAIAIASPPAVPQITQAIDATQRVTLSGNTNRIVTAGTNLGAVSDDFPIEHMQLLLRRSDAREQALEQTLDELHDPASPQFHQWLDAAQFGASYGPAPEDSAAIVAWLESNGFTVGGVYPSGLLIDFSGTAAQVRQTFGTAMANFDVGGTTYLSNVQDPSIPVALAGVVQGIVSLNNYFPRPQFHTYTRHGDMAQLLGISDFTFGDSNGKELFVAPADFNTI